MRARLVGSLFWWSTSKICENLGRHFQRIMGLQNHLLYRRLSLALPEPPDLVANQA
jgi:hypothetical protein